MYQAKDPQMAAYLRYVQVLKGAFVAFELVHVSREQNACADLLAKLANSGKEERQRTIIQETLKSRERLWRITGWTSFRSVRSREGRGVIGP